MTDESYSFTAAKSRLEEIVTQVRKKDTSLEKSLDLLEEGVRLANVCTELIDHADWASAPGAPAAQAQGEAAEGSAEETAETAVDAGAESAEPSDVAAVESSESADADAESPADDRSDAEPVGEVWSEDEAWSDEAEQDPSDGDDGHGD